MYFDWSHNKTANIFDIFIDFPIEIVNIDLKRSNMRVFGSYWWTFEKPTIYCDIV
jgi:hypothetical protein